MVKINMEKPSSCYSCRFCACECNECGKVEWGGQEYLNYCAAAEDSSEINLSCQGVPSNCPLIFEEDEK